MEPERERVPSPQRPGITDPAHAPAGQEDPNPGDPGPPVLPPRERTDPLRDPRLPEDEPPPRGV